MKKSPQNWFKAVATRGVIAAIPVAMASAYASNLFVPTPPRIAAYEFQQVAEITVSPDTVGVAASPLYGQTKAQIDQQLSDMQALGIQNIRVFVPWGLVDFFGPSEPGSFSWSTLDLVMQSAKEHDMGVLAEVNSTPPYAMTAGVLGSGTPDPAAFAAFMTKFVTKYGDTVSAYEIWNEPNSIQFSSPIDPAAYAALLKAAYQAIKPLDPTATIVAGAVGHTQTWGNLTMDPVDFVKAMIAADPTIGQYFDALSYHPYDENLPFSQGNQAPIGWASDTAFNQLKDLIALFPTKKVWISEFGVPTYSYTDANGVVHTITQDQQEKMIADLINTWGAAFGQNAGPIFLYTGRDTATGSPDPEANFGLWDMLGQPKEVITEFLAQWLKDHPQNSTTPTTPGQPTPVVNPLAALLQAISQQFQAIAAQFQGIAAQFQAAVAAFAQNISNFFAALSGAPAVTTSAPLTLRVASVAASDTTGAGDDVKTATETTATETTETATVTDKASEETKTTTAADESASVDAPTAAAAVEPAATAEPVVAQPVDVEVTQPTEPASSTPTDTSTTDGSATATEPTTTKPDTSTTPDTTKPDTTKPDSTSGTSKTDTADPSSTSNTKDASSTKPSTHDDKPAKTDKPNKTDKPDKAENSGRHSDVDAKSAANAASTSEGHSAAG